MLDRPNSRPSHLKHPANIQGRPVGSQCLQTPQTQQLAASSPSFLLPLYSRAHTPAWQSALLAKVNTGTKPRTALRSQADLGYQPCLRPLVTWEMGTTPDMQAGLCADSKPQI